jgi:hypothetical protein
MRHDRAFVLLAVPALLAAPAWAQDGYARAPFRDHPVALAQATALERIEAAGRGLAATAARLGPGGRQDLPDLDGESEIKTSLAEAWRQVQASLVHADPETAARLKDAVSAVLAEDEDGTAFEPRRADLATLAERARAALVPPDLALDPGFRAALVAAALLDEGGVAEAYDEAAGGERAFYPVGFAALERVRDHLQALRPGFRADEGAAIDAAVSALGDLFPGPVAPAALSPNREEAEAPAQQLVGLLEPAVGAELYPGRDLAGAATLVQTLAEDGCTRIRAGEGAKGLERLAIAGSYHVRTTAAALKVMAPDLAKRIRAGLEPAEDGEREAMAAACPDLLDALASSRSVLSP